MLLCRMFLWLMQVSFYKIKIKSLDYQYYLL